MSIRKRKKKNKRKRKEEVLRRMVSLLFFDRIRIVYKTTP
jgi:hypothetical protein